MIRSYKVLDSGWNISRQPDTWVVIFIDSIIEVDDFWATFRKKYPATNREKSMTRYCDVKDLLAMNVLIDVTTQVKRNKLKELYDNN